MAVLTRLSRFSFRRPALVLLLLGGWLAACKDTLDTPPAPTDAEQGRDFQPVAVGSFWIYDVTETYWNFNRDSVVRYQLRERVDTVFRGATDDVNYRIVRARRADSSSTWRDDSSFSLVITPRLVRRTFANQPTVELVFPVREGSAWNPNLFNSLDSTSRTYANFDQPTTLPGGRTLARTVQVRDAGEDNIFYRREHSSTYARAIGRISRVARSLDFCQLNDSINTGCSTGPGYIVRGQEREEYLLDYGPRP